MCTSILYHAFGLQGIEYRATHFMADRIVFSAEMNDQGVWCPQCGCRDELQRSKAQVVLHEFYGAQEVHAGARSPPFAMPGVLGAVVPTPPSMIGTHRFVRSLCQLIVFGAPAAGPETA